MQVMVASPAARGKPGGAGTTPRVGALTEALARKEAPLAPRSIWKGYLKVSELAVPVALYAGATTAQRVSFHILNRKTGNRVHREYVDEETGKPVERDQQVKGYGTGDNEYIVLEPEEVAEAVPESDKTLCVEAFIECPDVDTIYFDKPYFLAPADATAAESFAVLRAGMEKKGVAALVRAVLFRRVRRLLLRTQGHGLVANTLKFDYEVKSAEEAFEDLPEVKIGGEMLKLAKHIIETKAGRFDPRDFDDRYDQALAELVKAKQEGREIKAPKRPKETKVVDLMEALRQSAGQGRGRTSKKTAAKKSSKKKTAKRSTKKAVPERRKAS